MGEERSTDDYNIHHDISLCHHSWAWGWSFALPNLSNEERREDVDVDVGMEMSLPTPTPTPRTCIEVGIVCCDTDTGKVAWLFMLFLVPYIIWSVCTIFETIFEWCCVFYTHTSIYFIICRNTIQVPCAFVIVLAVSLSVLKRIILGLLDWTIRNYEQTWGTQTILFTFTVLW
jgi:hypothetical protein